MRFLSIYAVLLLTSCSANDQGELEVKANTCDIDYTRYQATVTGYCQESEAILPLEIPTIEKSIALRSITSIPEVFWYSTKMKYSLIKQTEQAPLVFVIAGTGASYNSEKMISLQKLCFNKAIMLFRFLRQHILTLLLI